MQRIALSLIFPFICMCLLPAPLMAQQCVEDLFCIITQKWGDTVSFSVDNLQSKPLKITIFVDAENMSANRDLPHVAVYPGNTQTQAFNLSALNPRKGWRYTYKYRWDKSLEERDEEELCAGEVFCIDYKSEEDVIHYYLINTHFAPISVEYKEKIFENLTANVAFPFAKSYPPKAQTYMFTARLIDEQEGWESSYSTLWKLGEMGAVHDSTYVYGLPFEAGTSYMVSQGFYGNLSHKGKQAIDWTMPEGTPIHAAREGVVIKTEASFSKGALDESFKDKSNYITILHDDGSMGSYLHLQKNGVLVEEGDLIARGQRIGLSGNTGFSNGPHLHFQVDVLGEDFKRHTVPIIFQSSEAKHDELKKGSTYTAQ